MNANVQEENLVIAKTKKSITKEAKGVKDIGIHNIPVQQITFSLGKVGNGTVNKDPSILLVPLDGVKLATLGGADRARQQGLLSSPDFDLVSK